MLAVDTKVNTDYIASSCWLLTFYLFLEKVLTLVLSFLLSERWTHPVLPASTVFGKEWRFLCAVFFKIRANTVRFWFLFLTYLLLSNVCTLTKLRCFFYTTTFINWHFCTIFSKTETVFRKILTDTEPGYWRVWHDHHSTAFSADVKSVRILYRNVVLGWMWQIFKNWTKLNTTPWGSLTRQPWSVHARLVMLNYRWLR